MAKLIMFCVVFALFMLRAKLLEWEFVLDTFYDEGLHVGSFLFLLALTYTCSFLVFAKLENAHGRLVREYPGVYVTEKEFYAHTPTNEVGTAALSYDSPKCMLND